MANLIYAVFWALLAAAIFIGKAFSPDLRGLTLPGTNVSAGWLALVLAAYNLVRWWSSRSLDRTKRMLYTRPPTYQRQEDASRHSPPQITDPQFSLEPEPKSKDNLPGT